MRRKFIVLASLLALISVIIIVLIVAWLTRVDNTDGGNIDGDNNEMDKSPGVFSLEGVSNDTFNPSSAQLQFTLYGAEFYQDLNDILLTINGNPIPSSYLSIEQHRLICTSMLSDGRNNISFSAYDTVGRPLYYSTTIWAGSEMLHIDVVNETGSPVTDLVVVEARLVDDQSVMVQATTNNGTVEFGNMPGSTILIKASTTDNRFGLIGVVGWEGFAKVRLLGFNAPSSIDNNDFNQSTGGWDIGTSPVQITEHVEGFPQMQILGDEISVLTASGEQKPHSELSIVPQLSLAAVNSIVDQDLILSTAGEGEQSISRTFETSPGTNAVTIRYRFITSEVPGNWFGSKFNDYFRVSLRSHQGGGLVSEANSMNGLGLGAFDYASGATAWREITLKTNTDADTIQVDVGVANVADDLYGSQVVIDFVREAKDEVRPTLMWNDFRGGLDLYYTVDGDQLQEDVTIDVYWANGPGYANRIGAPIFSKVVPAGTAQGSYGSTQIAGNLLTNNPAGVTHIIATSSPTNVGSVADVNVNYGIYANPAVVSAPMIDIIKDGLRIAGQQAATITSTARTPADQARAMFNNLVNPANPVNVNIANQLNIYGAPGDAVINVFVAQTQQMTIAQINQNRAAIEAAMVQEINNQGPTHVSNHCANPNQLCVVDVSAAAFNPNNGPLFVNGVQGRLSGFLDERNTNGCYHLELAVN